VQDTSGLLKEIVNSIKSYKCWEKCLTNREMQIIIVFVGLSAVLSQKPHYIIAVGYSFCIREMFCEDKAGYVFGKKSRKAGKKIL